MTERIDIAVVGAGLIGCAFALQMAQRTRLNVALFERSEPLNVINHDGNPGSKPSLSTTADSELSALMSSNQRVVALGAASVGLLQDVGVFDALSAHHAHPYGSMMIWDENSDGELNFAADDLGQTQLGFMVDAQACTQVLQQRAINADLPNLRCFFGAEIERLILDTTGAQFTCNGSEFKAKLLVGVDGTRSWVRSQAKIFAHRHTYNQRGIVAKIRTRGGHGDCAWQRFLQTGPVAALPVHDNYSSIVWSADDALADELMRMNDRDFRVALTQAFESRLGEVLELGPRQAFALASQKASSYIAPSLALMGDAAHSIHPLAGQGANLGFKDVICLSELLCRTNPELIGRLHCLDAYQTKRRRDNEQTDWLMTILHRAYQNESPLWLSLRGKGMNWINASQSLKNTLAKQAMGL